LRENRLIKLFNFIHSVLRREKAFSREKKKEKKKEKENCHISRETNRVTEFRDRDFAKTLILV